MSDTDKSGPALNEEVQELQAYFPNDATLQDAMGRLTLIGFDRADLSLPDVHTVEATPDEAASATSDIDTKQIRTMAAGFAGSTAGVAVAATLATGGLAAPLVAVGAGLSALGAAAATTGVGVVSEQAGTSERDRLGAEGKLILAVRLREPQQAAQATEALNAAGATKVASITRATEALTRGLNATSWTG